MEDDERRVFISYRRAGSWQLARLVFDDLTRHGFDAFMDVESIDNGKFERVILREIESRPHMVVVLEPGALPFRGSRHDWLSREIEHGMACGRNVVPLTAGGFRLGEVELPVELAELSGYNAVSVPPEYFGAAMERLRTRFLRPPSEGQPPVPAPPGPSAGGEIATTGRRVDAVVHAPLHGQADSMPDESNESDVYERLFRERTVVLSGDIDDGLANQVCAQLLLLDANDAAADISLYINSPGGSVAASMAIYDTMLWIKPDVSTVVMGLAAGTASLLLAAGARGKRLTFPHSRVLLLDPDIGAGGTEQEPAERAESLRRLRRELAEIYAERTGQSIVDVRSAMAAQTWYSATEARDAGLVDRIIVDLPGRERSPS